MTNHQNDALKELVLKAEAREALGVEASGETWTRDAASEDVGVGVGVGEAMYHNRNARLEIDFTVSRLNFAARQTLDPRVVRIAPGQRNELHKHAHETVFVILSGEGAVRVGDQWSPLAAGSVAFVPRWAMHQTRNLSATEPLVLVAITDFGFTSAVLGDYDRRTRLAQGGGDSAAG